jgi:hypothetical protein
MPRLRVRVELSRGGAGVPLHKLASVVEQARKFFVMLGEDVEVDPARGEWMGFDFDADALHFTAEYVGPVTADQVSAFHAAFDGTTSLRRATIAQFARITETIGEDELIGFGLYPANDAEGAGAEPGEWRCLSRRDALRIGDEMNVLSDAAREDHGEHDSHLPAASDSGARLFRRAARADESDLAGRLAQVESKVDQHSLLIGDLRAQSTATEQSFRNLLGAVENFCGQAVQQIERVTPVTISAPVVESPSVFKREARLPRWLVIAIGAAIALAAILASWRLWPARSEERVIAKSPGTAKSAAPAEEQRPPAAPAPAPAPTPGPAPAARPVSMTIDIDSTEPAWIEVADAHGERLAIGTIEPGKGREIEVDHPVWLRTGNAGGLLVTLNGKALGEIGPHGKVRVVAFRDGQFAISSPE